MTAKPDSLSVILRVIADPTRRRILANLKNSSKGDGKSAGLCASDIEARIGLSQPTISHHMGVLEKAGLVQSKKDQQWRRYQRNERAIKEFAKVLKESL
jgi:ArsR family transcriptional regulator